MNGLLKRPMAAALAALMALPGLSSYAQAGNAFGARGPSLRPLPLALPPTKTAVPGLSPGLPLAPAINRHVFSPAAWPGTAAAAIDPEPGNQGLGNAWQAGTQVFDQGRALTAAGREWAGTFPELEGGDRLTAVVLGASRGIGAAFVEELAKTGAFNLVVVSQNPERIQAKQRELSQRYPGLRFIAVAADVSEPSSVDVIFNAIPEKLKRKLAVFVHSAGTAVRDGQPGMRQMLAIKGSVAGMLAEKAADLMLARKEGDVRGLMIFVSSIASLINIPGMAGYSQSNRAFNDLAKTIAHRHAGRILAAASAPGFVMTDLVKDVVIDSFGLGPQTVESLAMPASDVARETLSAARQGEVLVIPGRINREFVDDYNRNPVLRKTLAFYAKMVSHPGPMRRWTNAVDPYMASFMPALIAWRKVGTAWIEIWKAGFSAYAAFWGIGRRGR